MATVPLAGVEIFYPIQPEMKSNRLVFRRDSMQWKGLQKSASAWRHEIITLRFRIKDVNISAFYTFHVTNKTTTVELDVPGLQPFIRAGDTHNVKIVTFSEPEKVMPKHYEMSVTYLNTVFVA